jgi:CRP-like cAMP-binding protein
MTKSATADRGVSPLDRAHSARLAGDIDEALRLVCAALAALPGDLAAGYLAARLLLDSGQPEMAIKAAPELLQRFVRRGDLGAACLCAELLDAAGGDRDDAFLEIARAFGAGSPRVSASPALPPPLPSIAIPDPALATLPTTALLAASRSALERLLKSADTLGDDAALPRLPLFGALAPAMLAKLLGVLELRELQAGQTAVHQGEEGREAFLLARGLLNVVRDDGQGSILLAVLGPGALFGEMALVSSAPRAASVLAVEPTLLLVAPRAGLEQLAKRDPTIGRELGQFCQARMLTNLLRHSRILSAVEPTKRSELIARFSAQTFQPGDVLVRQGEEHGSLFLIASGGVEVRSTDDDGDRVVLAQPGPGDVVGEISLVLRRPAVADVVAVHATVALELTRSVFEAAIREHPGLLQQLYEVATQREAETRSVVAREALDVSDNVLL